MKIGIINSKTLLRPNSGYRIDPDVHLSEGVQAREQLAHSPYGLSTVGENASKVFLGNIFSRVFVKDAEHGMPYLAASDTVLANIETGRYLSHKQVKTLKNLILKKDWILITCSGTLGNVTYTNKTFENHIATHDLIRVVPNDNKVNKGTLYAFLSGKYGYNQITQSQFGGVVKHINDVQTKAILVPVFPASFQQEVDDLIQESARLREEAASLLEEAKNLLSDYINIDFVSTSGCVKATRNIQDIRKSLQCRLDPPALMNNSVLAFEQMKGRCVKLAKCNLVVWYPGMFKRAYVKNGLPYMQGSSVFEVNPFVRCAHLAKSRTPKLEELWLKEDLILITCASSCGQIKLITKEYEDKGAIGSPDIIRIKSMDNLYTSGYLFTYLQMPIVQDYMQSFKYGSVIERFDALRIESIPVIKPTQELSNEITALINQYKDCTYRAFCAEEKAISMVEQEIESWTK